MYVNLTRDKKRETQASIEECKDPSYEEKSQAYQDAQEKFENLNAEYHAAKSERDYYWHEMKSVESSLSSLKNERTKTAQLLQEEETTQRVMALHNAGVEYPERADAKVLLQPDGTTQVYHGGIGYGDGYGHGHTVLDGDGKITYKREAFKPHGSQNYVKKKIAR